MIDKLPATIFTMVDGTKNGLTLRGPFSQKQVIEAEKGDKRFSNEAWQNEVMYSFIKQSYLLFSKTAAQRGGRGTGARLRRSCCWEMEQGLT